MNTTTSHLVEGTDLPTYEPGFGDLGYLVLNSHTKIVVPDQHVAFLDQLALAATNLAAVMRKAQEPTTQPAELQHPGTWRYRDAVVDDEGDVWVRIHEGSWKWIAGDGRANGHREDAYIDELLADGFLRIVHLVPRENGAV